MCPIRIVPDAPVQISDNQRSLRRVNPTTEPTVIGRRTFVLPVGKGNDYLVHVDGFAHAPGGIIETERLTTGHSVDNIALTTPDDPELSGELGVTAVTIDGVLYEAVNPEESGSR